jgi:BlaI family transcriptional regulator, penicillinase repressor
MKELTKAEEQIMQKLWKLKTAFVREIVDKFPEPKPAYTTIATIIKILEKKGFVGHEDYGKIFKYYPIVAKDVYASQSINNFVKDYFENSFKNLVSFFSHENKITIEDIEEIKNILSQNNQAEE